MAATVVPAAVLAARWEVAAVVLVAAAVPAAVLAARWEAAAGGGGLAVGVAS